jgi:four helix bundle protein
VSEQLKQRTRLFVLRVIRLCESLPKNRTADVIGKQLIRCGTSVGANYRAATRARSDADFIAKMGIVEEECDECAYWMELLVEANLVEQKLLENLMKETDELLSITIASIKTAKTRQTRKSEPRTRKDQ